MKKLFFSLICLWLVCSFLIACEDKKDSDKEIKDPNGEITKIQDAHEDDPNNGYGDIIIPQD